MLNKEETDKLYPQRILYESEDGVIFDSRFEGGNMARVEKMSDHNYNVWVASDEELSSSGSSNKEKKNICWFLFKVSNVPHKQVLKITIKNLGRLTLKILNEGYTPAFRIVKRSTEEKPKNFDENFNLSPDFKASLWERINKEDFRHKAFGDEIQLFINFTFDESFEAVYFAYSPNFSFSDINLYFQHIENSLKFESTEWLYFFREVITQSFMKTDVDLITVTSNKGYSKNREEFFDPFLFPKKAKSSIRPLKFDKKKVVIISTRTHAGETPSSFIMKGIVDFLLEHKTNPISKALMDEFVFLLIPTMNPDGMINGHYRLDATGSDLNRLFNSFDRQEHPSIYALLKLVEYNVAKGKLAAYFDLHAHNSKFGAFLLGNTSPDIEIEAEIKLFPCLMNLICEEFNSQACNFSCDPPKDSKLIKKDRQISQKQAEATANKKGEKSSSKAIQPFEKDDQAKGESGVAKTVVFKMSDCPLSYTVEVNYNGGPVNRNVVEGRSISRTKGGELDIGTTVFMPKNFENVGRSLCEALALRFGLIHRDANILGAAASLRSVNPEDLKQCLIKEISDQRLKKCLD